MSQCDSALPHSAAAALPLRGVHAGILCCRKTHYWNIVSGNRAAGGTGAVTLMTSGCVSFGVRSEIAQLQEYENIVHTSNAAILPLTGHVLVVPQSTERWEVAGAVCFGSITGRDEPETYRA